MTCHLGDLPEYAAAARRRQRREATWPGRAPPSGGPRPPSRWSGCGPATSSGSRPAAGPASPSSSTRGSAAAGPAPAGAHRGPLGRPAAPADFPAAVEPLGRVRVPRDFNARSPPGPPRPRLHAARSGSSAGRRHRARRGRRRRRPVLADLRAALRRHPCHGCADREEHARWAERWHRLRGDTDALERKVAGDRLDRPHLRPGLRGAGGAGYLDPPTRGHRRPAASWPGSGARATCSSSSACAPGSGTAWPGRARRRRVGAGLRDAPAATSGGPPVPGRAVPTRCARCADWARLEEAESEPACRSCASRTPASPGGLALGLRRRPGRGARRRRGDHRGRLRALEQAGDRPARPGRRVAEPGSPVAPRRPAALAALRRGVVAYTAGP